MKNHLKAAAITGGILGFFAVCVWAPYVAVCLIGLGLVALLYGVVLDCVS